jgi:hypothetical protein
MKTTKTFSSWIGDKELTREEYIKMWMEETIKFGALFEGKGVFKFFDIRDAVAEQAGIKWDQAE